MQKSGDTPFNGDEDEKLYFGDREQQESVTRSILSAGDGKSSRLHLITGGTHTGKSALVQNLKSRLESNNGYQLIDAVVAAHMPEDVIPKALSECIRAEGDDFLIDADLNIYRDKAKKSLMLIEQNDTSTPGNPEGYQHLKRVADALKNMDPGWNVTWVVDAPVVDQIPPIFKPTPLSTRMVQEHRSAMGRLQQESGDTLVVHEMKYNVDTIRESYWEHFEQYGKAFADYMDHSRCWEKSPEWNNVCAAALAGDRAKYNEAFAVVAKRVQSPENPPLPA